MKKFFLALLLAIISLPSLAVAAEPIATQTAENVDIVTRPLVRILNSTNFEVAKEFYPFNEDSTVEGANIVTADLNNDGYKEIIVGAGRNEKPLIRIFNQNGEFISEFLAYADNYRQGVKVIVADLYKDGSPEIITAPYEGGSAHIRIFDNLGFLYYGFFAFSEEFRGGANVAVGDVNGDGQNEIIVGSGYNQEPVIKIFDNYSNFIKGFYVFEDTYKWGVNVLTADLDNSGTEKIIVAPYLGKEPIVKIFDFDGQLINKFLAYPSGFRGGVNLAKSDIDKDGLVEILTGAGYGGGSHLRFFDAQGKAKINPKLFVFPNFKGGISIADGNINNDGQTEILAATQTISPNNKYQSYKIIEVDLRQQKLFTYLKGQLDQEFLISSGLRRFPTPKGTFKVYAKIPLTRMAGYYGPDSPDNYDLANVPWVLPFKGAYTIHGTYWHHNFGHPMSHGCINMSKKDAKTVYDWADMGIPVIIYSSNL